MALWNVMYASWQMECCGTPFALDDEVAWPLMLQEPGEVLDPASWEGEFSEVEGPVEEVLDEEEDEEYEDEDGLDGEDGDEGLGEEYWDEDDEDDEDFEPLSTLVVRQGGLAVAWVPGPGRPSPPPERARLRGLLTVERHSAVWPDTVGRVRSVHIVTQGYAETAPGSRSYEPVPGERWLREVEACPKWFMNEGEGQRDGRGYHRTETGVLVRLEVPDPA